MKTEGGGNPHFVGGHRVRTTWAYSNQGGGIFQIILSVGDCEGDTNFQIILSGGERKANERGVCPNPLLLFLVAVGGAGLRKSSGGRDIQIIPSRGDCEMGNEVD